MNKTNAKGSYTLREEKKLLKIKPGNGAYSKTKVLATAFGRNHGSVYQKWRTLHAGANKAKAVASAAITAVAAPTGKDIQPYVLETGAEMPTRMDNGSAKQLKARLGPTFDAMVPGVHSVPIYKNERATIRKWLSTDKSYKRNVYTISPIKENPKMLRVFRKL